MLYISQNRQKNILITSDKDIKLGPLNRAIMVYLSPMWSSPPIMSNLTSDIM